MSFCPLSWHGGFHNPTTKLLVARSRHMGKGSTCYILLIRNTLQRTTEKHSRKKKKKRTERKVSQKDIPYITSTVRTPYFACLSTPKERRNSRKYKNNYNSLQRRTERAENAKKDMEDGGEVGSKV